MKKVSNDNRKIDFDMDAAALQLAAALAPFLNPPKEEWGDYVLEFSATRKVDDSILLDRMNLHVKQV